MVDVLARGLPAEVPAPAIRKMIAESVAAEMRRLAEHPILAYDQYRARKARARLQYYPFRAILGAFPVELAANASVAVSLKVDADRDFDALKGVVVATDIFAVENLMYKGFAICPGRLHSSAFFSTDIGLPTIFPESLLIRAGDEVLANFVDLSGLKNVIWAYWFGVAYLL